ncbi:MULTISPECIES: hypothetical protein [unclassified Pseudomonas]|uniref:hypothetical protein n=1 Tax=unclassified Pseudomonas TaxID=196821 RepID=UPI00119A32C9|nr:MULTISPECIES: hypothetical protein [unclassified Pseudomonas]TWC20609.1 hypothetical protein FBY00_104238 [Pseudomonas sp. SJZ075]TWC25509.1 hypothetical protein FBX99_10145 [Pseudomonas sp. SJZ074]TWC36039.1 hypothetical protein FBY02_104239 [Pseudomonas sp. SJZ078]TWC42320.1 hypothetical protein FBY06_10145 [Pseudomonas sp. SJZ085]TWC56907.1 hypothetical protein FBY11_104238 [Pseudomonas sp. SJZ124]
MKFDLAYCLSLDEKLSIYDVRDLNFDETVAFDSAKEHFQCPNDACRAAFDVENVLGTFNAKNVRYVRTPHFKNIPSTRHIEGCPYVSLKAPAAGLEAEGAEMDDGREEHFPSELLLTRREYVRKPSNLAVVADSMGNERAPSPASHVEHPSRDSAPDKTSVFAHPVECFVSNFADKDLLKRMPLKIGEHTAPYASFFKKIEYLLDNKGLIYWGKIKEIKDYTQSFRIDFEQKVWFKQADDAKKKPYSVNVYLSKKLIDNYRKRKAFLEEIKHAVDSEAPLYCFFYGVTPGFKQVPSKKNPEQTFGVFSANIENLDHFIIREAPGLADG